MQLEGLTLISSTAKAFNRAFHSPPHSGYIVLQTTVTQDASQAEQEHPFLRVGNICQKYNICN